MPTRIEVLAELTAARDEARLQLHLFSMQAGKRWQELETKLEALEQKVNAGGEKTSDAVVARARELAQAVRHFLETLRTEELSAPVYSIMTEAVRACSPSDTLNHAAQIFWETNCGAAPVVAADGVVIGMITDRDVCMACYTQGATPSGSTVESAMSKTVYACSSDATIESVLELMGKYRIRRVPITTAAGRLSGIVTLADIARWAQSLQARRSAAHEALAAAVGAISKPVEEAQVTALAAE